MLVGLQTIPIVANIARDKIVWQRETLAKKIFDNLCSRSDTGASGSSSLSLTVYVTRWPPTAPLAVKLGFLSLSLAFRLGPVGGCHQVETLKYRSLIFILFRVQRSVDPGSSSTAGGRIQAGKNHFQDSHFFFSPLVHFQSPLPPLAPLSLLTKFLLRSSTRN